MLDEQEYAEAVRIYEECSREVKEFRQRSGASLGKANLEDLFRPVRESYEQLTGISGFHQDALMRHRLSSLGEPCKACGKPLRTKRATLCGSCGGVLVP